MRRVKLALMILPVVLAGFSLFLTTPVNAACAEGEVETNFFGCVKDDNEGCGVWLVINMGLTILTYGVGIAATIGLVITAILYLTSRDNTGQLAKAKTRILEIVIGLAIYAAMWSIVSWLIPGGMFNGGEICKTSEPTAGSSAQTKYADDKSDEKQTTGDNTEE